MDSQEYTSNNTSAVAFSNDGAMVRSKGRTRRVDFILYNVPSRTGVVANSPYIRLLEALTTAHCEHYYRGQYKTSKYREDYIRCPYGYKTKVFIKTAFVKTKHKAKDEQKFFDSMDY